MKILLIIAGIIIFIIGILVVGLMFTPPPEGYEDIVWDKKKKD